MSDSPKQCGPMSAPSATFKQPSTRPLKQFPVLNVESGGSEQPKPATVKAEKDRPPNLLPMSHRADAANLKPNPDDPRDVLRRSTEHNAAPSSFTLPVPHTSHRIVDTAGVESGPHRGPSIEHRQYWNSKSIVEYQPAPLDDRQEPLAQDTTTFVHPPRPQIVVGPPGESHTETRFEFELLLTARATARGKWPLLCTGVVPPLLRVQPPQRHKTALRLRRINGTTSCTIKVWQHIPLAHLR